MGKHFVELGHSQEWLAPEDLKCYERPEAGVKLVSCHEVCRNCGHIMPAKRDTMRRAWSLWWSDF